MKTIFPLLLITLLFGCKQPAKKNSVSYTPKDIICNLPNSDKIIFIDNVYREYLEAVRIERGIRNKDSLYRQIISNCFGVKDCNHGWLIRHNTDTVYLVNYLSAIEGSQKNVKELFTTTLADANKILKNDSITFYVLPFIKDQRLEKEGGVDVLLLGGSMQMNFCIDTTVGTWREMLKYCVAREFYLDYWAKMHRKGNDHWTILHHLILEGEADFYAHLIYPDINCPWTNSLKAKDEKLLWRKIKPDLQSMDIGLQWSIMIGSYKNPSWGGHTLGYHIVQSALKNHPELTPEQWTNLSPEKILKMSDYR